jgi:hypothetical protein
MRMRNVQIKCPGCDEWMLLDDFDLKLDPKANKVSVVGEIECPNDVCGLTFEVTDGEASYKLPRRKR